MGDYKSQTVKTLKQWCALRQISGTYKMNKAALIDALEVASLRYMVSEGLDDEIVEIEVLGG